MNTYFNLTTKSFVELSDSEVAEISQPVVFDGNAGPGVALVRAFTDLNGDLLHECSDKRYGEEIDWNKEHEILYGKGQSVSLEEIGKIYITLSELSSPYSQMLDNDLADDILDVA